MKTRSMPFFGALLLASLFSSSETPIHFRGMNYTMGGYNPIYFPKRTKFKGWMREKRKCSFNRNK